MAVDFSGLYDVRDYRESDKSFILATFLRGMYYGESYFSLMQKDTFMNNYKKVGEALVARANIKVACLKEDSDVILGYSILSHDYQTIHFVYVKNSKLADGDSWRNKGIARALTPRHPTTVTHLTELGKKLMIKIPTAVFDPFKLNL
jgi:hypothetical protein